MEIELGTFQESHFLEIGKTTPGITFELAAARYSTGGVAEGDTQASTSPGSQKPPTDYSTQPSLYLTSSPPPIQPLLQCISKTKHSFENLPLPPSIPSKPRLPHRRINNSTSTHLRRPPRTRQDPAHRLLSNQKTQFPVGKRNNNTTQPPQRGMQNQSTLIKERKNLDLRTKRPFNAYSSPGHTPRLS